MKIGFIGAGNMAGAIIRGMVAAGYHGNDILVYDIDAHKLAELFEQTGVCVCRTPQEVVEGSKTVVVAVKPQVLQTVLSQLSVSLHRSNPLVVSIAAGKSLTDLEIMCGKGLSIVRVMPNLNARVGEGIAAFCSNEQVTSSQKDTVCMIFRTVGDIIELEEKHFALFTSLASCSPAFTMLYIDALAQAGVRFGLPKATALQIAEKAVLGTARLMQETGEHPRALMDQVCSPGGTTIEGVCALQQRGFEVAVQAAVQAALEKDRKL